MIDFVSITLEDFYAHKDYVDPTIEKKLTDLLNDFSCFNDFIAFNTYNKIRKPHHHHAHASYKKHFITNSNLNKSQRDFLSWLNKLSPANFNVMSKRFILHTTLSNCEEVIESILDKCQTQPLFLNTYINLIREIKLTSSKEVRQKVMDTIKKYIDDFILKAQFDTFELDSKDYDTFCRNVLNKSTILGKHKTVIKLMKEVCCEHSDAVVDTYFTQTFSSIIDIGVIEKDDTCEKVELLLEMLGEFFEHNADYHVQVNAFFNTHTHIVDSYTLKARFKLLDLLSH